MKRARGRRCSGRPESETAANWLESEESPDQLWKLLEMVNGWIRHSDAKAGVALTFAGALAVMTYNLTRDSIARSIHFDVAVVVACAALLATGAFCGLTLMPRLKDKATQKLDPSHIYFGSVATFFAQKRHEYVKELSVLTRDSSGMTQELAHQVYVNSKIANTKARWAIWAMRAALLSAALVGVVALLVGIANT